MENEVLYVKVASTSNNMVFVHFSEKINSTVQIQLTTMEGKVVMQQSIINPQGQQVIKCNNNVKGMLLATITDQNNLHRTKPVIL